MKHFIQVKVQFRAAHRLLPPYKGKCNDVHGEGYTLTCIFGTNELDENGMVIDFGTIKKQIKEWIDDNMDHAYIANKRDHIAEYLQMQDMKVYLMNGNPTAENIGKEIYDYIKKNISSKIAKVGVTESFDDSIAWYQEF